MQISMGEPRKDLGSAGDIVLAISFARFDVRL